jgi:hypothetical protein
MGIPLRKYLSTIKRAPKISIVSVCISILALALLSVCLFTHYSHAIIDWTKTKDVTDVLKNVGELFAITIGGCWAYFHFFKGRTYRARLEPKVSGRLKSVDGVNYLVATTFLKNVGLSDVTIEQEGSALSVFCYKADIPSPVADDIEDEHLAIFPVFTNHAWIEPGELIEDERLIAVPGTDKLFLRLELRIVSNKIDWNAVSIIEPATIEDISKSIRQLIEGEVNTMPENKAYRPPEGDWAQKQQRENQQRTQEIERQKVEQQERSHQNQSSDRETNSNQGERT